MAKKKIGRICNFFGLKGQLKVQVSSTTAVDRFKVGKKVIIKNQNNVDETYTITDEMVKNAKIIVISLEGYDDINDIQWLIGRDVYQDVRPPKGTFFYDELVDMEVIDSSGNTIGNVTTVTNMPAGDYLLVNGKIYIPFLMDNFIKEVDKKNKKIYLTELGTEASK